MFYPYFMCRNAIFKISDFQVHKCDRHPPTRTRGPCLEPAVPHDSSGSNWSRWYTSYCNVFLFRFCFALITSFCCYFTYIETWWNLWNEAWNDPMEILCSRWPYMVLCGTLQWNWTKMALVSIIITMDTRPPERLVIWLVKIQVMVAWYLAKVLFCVPVIEANNKCLNTCYIFLW